MARWSRSFAELMVAFNLATSVRNAVVMKLMLSLMSCAFAMIGARSLCTRSSK